MKNEKFHTVGTFPKFNIKIVERVNIDTRNILMYDCSLSWLDTSINSGGVKLVFLGHTSPLSEI